MIPIPQPTGCRALLVGFSIATLVTIGSLQAELAAYGVFKGENYDQASASAPGAGQLDSYGVRGFAVTAPEADPFLIYVWPESEFGNLFSLFMQPLEGRPEWVGEAGYPSASERDASFPDGLVTFQVLSFTGGGPDATVTLTTPALPPIPAVANYAETQAIEPGDPFTLRWNSFAGAGSQDLIWVWIDSSEGMVFSTPVPGAPGALAGTATQVVIPPGALSQKESLTATIAFVKVGTQTSGSYPNSTARTGSYRQTFVNLKLAGGGNGDPTDGPVLLATAPADGAVNVRPDTAVRFDFSRPMAPVVDIVWLADGIELPDSSFSYSWSGDGFTLLATYPPAFPEGAFVIWALGEGFQDTTGAPLTGDNNTGFFLVGGGNGNGDCDEGDPFDEEGTFFLSRTLLFEQTGPGTLVPGAEQGAFFAAVFSPPIGFTASSASFTPPSSEPIPMAQFFGGPFLFSDAFENQAGLDAAFPAGNYAARVEPTSGNAIQMTVSVSATSVPTPEFLNYTEGQAVEPSAPFTVTWNSFTGANASSFISLEILDLEGDTVFSAPNECTGLELDPAATSIVIPAGTLAPGRVYELSLGFFRITDTREHGASEITFMTAQGANTTTTLRTVGGSVDQDYRFSEARISASGRFQATVTGTPGTFITVEWTDNWVDWELVTTLTLPGNGSASFEDPNPPAAGGQRFYRVLRP